MIEQITSSNSKEFEKRYRDTFGFLKTKTGKNVLVNVTRVGGNATDVRDYLGNYYTLNSDTGCELEFTQVPSQWFNPIPGVIVYVSRRAERQWRRGICEANTTMLTPLKNGLRLATLDITPDRISQLFYPENDCAAFDGAQIKECGLWSKYFAWAINTVYVRDMQIGMVDHEKRTVKLDDPELFVQEMKDALARSNSNYKVVND